jgi:hypothetical protein
MVPPNGTSCFCYLLYIFHYTSRHCLHKTSYRLSTSHFTRSLRKCSHKHCIETILNNEVRAENEESEIFF